MADFLYKVVGNVAYSDDSSGSFEATSQNGIEWTTAESYAQGDFAQLYTDESTTVDALLALFTGATHTLSVSAPATDKTVTSYVMEVSGRIARDNDTWEDFCVQYRDGGNVVVENDTAYTEAVANSTFLAAINTVFDSLTSGNATIS